MELKEIVVRFRKEINEALSETDVPCEICFEQPAEKMAFFCKDPFVNMTFLCKRCYQNPANFVKPDGSPIADQCHFAEMKKV